MNMNFDKYGRPIYENGEAPREEQTYSAPAEHREPVFCRKTATGRDMVFVLICLVVSIVSVDFLFWSGAGIGISVCSALVLAVSLAYLAGRKMKMSFYTVILSVMYLALGASLTFSDGGFSKFLCISLMGLVYTVILIDVMSVRRFEGGTFRSLGDVFYGMFALTFGKIGKTLYAVFHKKDGELIITRKTGSIFIGFAFALPVLCIIIPLLASGDAAFEGLLDKITFDKVWEIICAIIVGAFIFVLWFGQLLFAPETNRERVPEKGARRGIEPTVLASFLAVISIAYLLYLFSQLAYFFDAFSGILPEGFKVADYARRGFFEMVTVCAINLFFVFLVMLICRRKTAKAPVSVRILCAFLCIFSLVLVATSLSKMLLYIDSFGMTRLRIFTSVFMVFMAVVFLAVIVRLFVKKMPYMKAALVAAAVLVASMCFVDVDGVIAKYNVEAYLDGRLDAIDMNALDDLSSDAIVPYVLELIDDDNEQVASDARAILNYHAHDMFEFETDGETGEIRIRNAAYDFRRYNVHEYRARKLLMENIDEYYMPDPWY